MKTIKFTGLLLIAMALSARLIAQDFKQQLVVELSQPGKPYKLNVNLVMGTINVTTYAGKDIIIDAQSDLSKQPDRNREEHAGMKRISAAGGLDVSATEKDNTVQVTSGNPNKNIALTIKVPQGTNVFKLHTVMGIINAADISGDIEVNGTNGAIKLSNVGGSVVANTVNGAITVTLKSIDPKAAMAFTTLNGNVDVTFPASLKANVKLRSDNGDILSDFDMVPNKGAAPKAVKTAKDGLYRIQVEDWVYGSIGGGGPEFLMKNMNGNIYLRKSK